MSISPNAVRVRNTVGIKMEDLRDVDGWNVVGTLVEDSEEMSE